MECLILWNNDIKNLIENKKKAYLRYLTTRSETDKLEYEKVSGNCEKRNKKKLKGNFGKHLYRELNMIYMDAR